MRTNRWALAAILPLLVSGFAAADRSTICPISAAATATTVRVAGRLFSTAEGSIKPVAPTRDCLACHDGTVARQASLASVSFSSADRRAGDHPVDIAYPTLDPRFRPLSEVERTLPLEGGLLTCNTCHAGSSPANAYLTVSNYRSALCLTCHVK